MEKEIFSKFEQKKCELQEITDMLWLVYEDYYTIKENSLYTKADNYDRLGRYLINIHSLLYTRHKEMEEIVNEVYAERKAKKVGVENAKNM